MTLKLETLILRGGYAQGSVRMQKFNDALRDAKLTNVYQEFIRISYYNHYPEPK